MSSSGSSSESTKVERHRKLMVFDKLIKLFLARKTDEITKIFEEEVSHGIKKGTTDGFGIYLTDEEIKEKLDELTVDYFKDGDLISDAKVQEVLKDVYNDLVWKKEEAREKGTIRVSRSSNQERWLLDFESHLYHEYFEFTGIDWWCVWG